MTKQGLHKIAVVVLLLAIFTVPFYIERNQISSWDNSAYMAGAVLKESDTAAKTQISHDNLTGSVGAAWASGVGNSFVGDNLSTR